MTAPNSSDADAAGDEVTRTLVPRWRILRITNTSGSAPVNSNETASNPASVLEAGTSRPSAHRTTTNTPKAPPYVNPRVRHQNPAERNSFIHQDTSRSQQRPNSKKARVNPTRENPNAPIKWTGFPKHRLEAEWLVALQTFCGPGGGAFRKVGKVRKIHVKSRNTGPVHGSKYRPSDVRECLTVCVKGVQGVECCHVFIDGTGTRNPYDFCE